jgi:hypothetical protein
VPQALNESWGLFIWGTSPDRQPNFQKLPGILKMALIYYIFNMQK